MNLYNVVLRPNDDIQNMPSTGTPIPHDSIIKNIVARDMEQAVEKAMNILHNEHPGTKIISVKEMVTNVI